MNSKRFVLAAFAATACFTSLTTFAGEQDTWLEYAKANGLPLTATSNPAASSDWLIMEMSLGQGNADRALYVRELVAKSGNGHGNGNGNGNGHSGNAGNGHTEPATLQPCADPWTRELNRTDGNPQGDDLRCK